MKLVDKRSFGFGVVALLSLMLQVGCGGGGGGGGGEGGSQTPVGDESGADLAPVTMAGQTLTLQNGEAREITFGTSGNVWSEVTDAGVQSGTYEYRPNGSTADLVFAGTESEFAMRLAFGSANSGTYTVLQGNSDQGTFTLQPTAPPEVPGNDGENGGLAPGSLDGLVLYGTRTFTTTGPVGQTHVYTFSGNTFHDSDPPEESDGAYDYRPSGNRAALTLNYYSPADFNGDRHDLRMEFHTESSGAFESEYTRRDGTVIRINGTFLIGDGN